MDAVFKQILKSSEDIFLTLGTNRILMNLAAAIQPFATMGTSIQFYFQENIQGYNYNHQRDIPRKYESHRRQRIKHQTYFLEFFKLRHQRSSFF